MQRIYLALLAFALGIAGCFCDRQVRFGLDRKDGEPLQEDETSPQEPSEAHPGELRLGHARIDIQNAQLLEVLRADFNQDGQEDLLWLERENARIRLLSLNARSADTRDRKVIAQRDLLNCTLERSEIKALPKSLAALMLELDCGAGTFQEHWVFTLTEHPGLVERIAIDTLRSSALGLEHALSAFDVNQDGFEDVELKFSIGSAGEETIQAPLHWLNQPSGFVLDLSALEQHLSQSSYPLLVEKLLSALCMGPQALVKLSNRSGIDCKTLSSLGLVVVTQIETELNTGNVSAAIRRLTRALSDGIAFDENANARLDQTWKKAPAKALSSEVTIPFDQETSLDWIAFNESDQLILSGDQQYQLDITSKRIDSLSGATIPPPLRDPRTRLQAKQRNKSCDYVEIDLRWIQSRIARERTTRIDLSDSDSCTTSSVGLRGWNLIGWAPQGLVFSRFFDVRIAPLGLDGSSNGTTTLLKSPPVLPAPLRGPTVTPDGQRVASRFVDAFLILEFGPSPQAYLLRPSTWKQQLPRNALIAIHPSKNQLAFWDSKAIQVITWQ